MYVWWYFGAFLGIAGYSVSLAITLTNGAFWNSVEAKERSSIYQCSVQLDNREKKLNVIEGKLTESIEREKYFESILLLPDRGNSFVFARAEIARERELQKELRKQTKGLIVEPVKSSFWWEFSLVIFVIAFSGWLGKSLLNESLSRFIPGEELTSKWRMPFLIIVLILFGTHSAEQVVTHIYDTDKSWFHWSSFCISPSAFITTKLSFLGLFICLAFPICVVFCISSRQYIPTSFDLQHKDGRCGVGEYIDFIQKWVFIALLGGILPILVGIRAAISNQANFDYIYLVTPTVELAIMFF